MSFAFLWLSFPLSEIGSLVFISHCQSSIIHKFIKDILGHKLKKWVYELFARVCKGGHRRAQFDFSPMLCDLWVVLSCYNDESCDNLLFPLRDSILLDESMLSPQFTVSCGISLYAVPGSPSLWPVRKLAAPQECPGACSHCPGFSHPERAAAALGS